MAIVMIFNAANANCMANLAINLFVCSSLIMFTVQYVDVNSFGIGI
jgi:hypothetical protein